MAKFLILDYSKSDQELQVRVNLDHLVEIQDIVLEDGTVSDNGRYILSNGNHYDAPIDPDYITKNIREL